MPPAAAPPAAACEPCAPPTTCACAQRCLLPAASHPMQCQGPQGQGVRMMQVCASISHAKAVPFTAKQTHAHTHASLQQSSSSSSNLS